MLSDEIKNRIEEAEKLLVDAYNLTWGNEVRNEISIALEHLENAKNEIVPLLEIGR